MKRRTERVVRNLRSVWVCVALVLALTPPALADRLPLPPALVGLSTVEGEKFFDESDARQAYWKLEDEFVTQEAQSFCGVASLVMVLNALAIPAPVVRDYGTFTGFTQDNVFNSKTEAILPAMSIPFRGMTLDQVGAFAASYGATVAVFHAGDANVDRFRADASKALGAPGHFVIVNYLRTALGQQEYGHISPLGAYDSHADRFLILDVARYKYPPVWVKTTDLFAAMNTIDSGNANKTRGYIIVGAAR